MRKKILTVTDAFWISGRGLAIVEFDRTNELKFTEIGTPLIIICPDGKTINSEIGGSEKITTVSGRKGEVILLLSLTRQDVPIGSNVFVEID